MSEHTAVPVPPVGTVVRMTFEGRGLARVLSQEDGQAQILYLPDPDRSSEYMRAGDTEWASPLDLEAA